MGRLIKRILLTDREILIFIFCYFIINPPHACRLELEEFGGVATVFEARNTWNDYDLCGMGSVLKFQHL